MSKIVRVICILAVAFCNAAAQMSSPDLEVKRPPSPRGDIAFSVRKATEDLRAQSRVHFEDVLTNLGSGWEHRFAQFNAPVNGGYFFIFHAVSAERSGFQIELMKNRRTQVTAYVDDGPYQHGSSSVFLELVRGDIVSLEITEGEIYEHPRMEAYTTFSGFLVFNFE